MPRKSMDLDVDAPDKVSDRLLNAAEAFYESASELEADWQDRGAGKPWTMIAKILESAAMKIKAKL